MKKLFSLLVSMSIMHASIAQLGIGTTFPHPSAALDVSSTDKAFYPPRLTTQQRQAIINPQAGALVFDNTKASLFLFDGQSWVPLAAGDPNASILSTRTASDAQTYDAFGSEVAISGDYAIAGAPDKTAGNYSKVGGVYIFHRVNGRWQQEYALAPPSPAADLHYGYKVDIFNNYSIVSTGGSNNVYIYQRFGTLWTLVSTVVASGNESGVSISADHAVVASDVSIKVFKNSHTFITSWTLQTTLVPSDYYGPIDRLGCSVSVWQNEFIVGAYGKRVGTGSYDFPNVGKSYVYVLNNNTWTQQAILYNYNNPQGGNGYKESEESGTSVDIQGDTAIVGAPGRNYNNVPQYGRGAFYIFKRTGTIWTLIQTIDGPEYEFGRFGNYVAISGSYFLASAPLRLVNNQHGAVYIYKYNSAGFMTLQRRVTTSSADGLGDAAALSGNTYIIGNKAAQLYTGLVTFGDINN